MTREEEKPFVCTKNGVSFNIMPRNRAGWIYTGLWLLPALILALLFGWIMKGGEGSNSETVFSVAVFVVAMTVWAVWMARWMYVRSEIIDVRKLTEEHRRRDRDKP